MSTRGLRVPPVKGYVRSSRRRKMVLDVDLNDMPPGENRDQEGTSTHPGSGQQGESVPPAPIDVEAIHEAIDDDVLLSSPRAFAEARNNSRRTRGRAAVLDVDSEELTPRFTVNSRNKRSRVPANQTIINCDLYINLEGSSSSTIGNAKKLSEQTECVRPPPPPPKEPTFSCPVCMGPLVEEMSTKCGHIFCKKCIKAAIAAQSKCPTCRRKVTMKDTIRVYLPSTS